MFIILKLKVQDLRQFQIQILSFNLLVHLQIILIIFMEHIHQLNQILIVMFHYQLDVQ